MYQVSFCYEFIPGFESYLTSLAWLIPLLMMFKQCDLLNFLRFIKLTENERLLLSKNLTAKNIQDQLIILQVRIMQFYFKCFQTIFITFPTLFWGIISINYYVIAISSIFTLMYKHTWRFSNTSWKRSIWREFF